MNRSVKRLCLATAVGVVCAAAAPATASAGATVADYSCDIDLSVSTVVDNGKSGPITASGSGQCWLGDPNHKVPTQFSVSGNYTAQRCSLISVAQPSYLTVTGTLTMTPAGGSAMSTGVTITTADVATSNGGAGTIALGSGQRGPITVDYDSGLLGFVARCGGGDFFPSYGGTFIAGPTNSTYTRSTPLSGAEQSESSAGDPDGTGNASFTIYPGAAKICFTITHSNIDPTQAGHIHQGARGANGPPVVNLYSSTGTNGGISDCVNADPATINGLINTPSNYYVQLHNYAYLLGVIRGQLGD